MTGKERVYQKLRGEIVSLALPPGKVLDLCGLCTRFDLSRSPVREALLQLSRDHLVDIAPQRGTRVSFLDADIIRQERFMREALEIQALNEFLSIERSEIEHQVLVQKLRSNLLEQHEAVEKRDFFRFLSLDDRLHSLFYLDTGYPNVWSVLYAHNGNERRIRVLSYLYRGVVENVENEHRELVEAIAAHDNARAVELDRFHLTRLNEELPELERKFPDYFIRRNNETES